MLKNKLTEGEEQKILIEWAEYQKCKYPGLELLFHIPNEGKRSYATGGKMKSEGMKKGVPDLFLPVAKNGYHGMFIEMKREKGGRTSAEQLNWIKQLNMQGYYAVVCRGFEEAKAEITAYMTGGKK